jgi:membrane-associated phospholipid phosphatase
VYTLFFILGLASFFLYFPMENRKVKGHFLQTKLDKKLPIITAFVIPYLLFFPYVFGVYIWAYASNSSDFIQLAVAIIAVSILTTIIYLTYPSMMVRPFQRGRLITNSWTDKLVKRIERFDKPNNVFPSNHVAYSLIITLFLVTIAPQFAWIFWLIFLFISASTVLIKQHDLIDIPAAVVLAVAIWYVVGYFL